MPGRVVIVDDEPDMVENCVRILERAGHSCRGTTDPREALRLIESEAPDLVITDLKMPDVDGVELLRHAHDIDPELPIIVITAFATIESAVAAVKEGAFDYLPKGFSVDQLDVAVERALRQRALARENRDLRDQIKEVLGPDRLLGASAAMARVVELVRKAAQSDANILVLGESGTGKELVARAIHANSPRARRAFVPVDCAALPENLLESELFGHEKGAFTGAVKTKPGLMELAHQGTLFLDEIGEMPIGLQAKLLRALQERHVRRVGGTMQIPVDIRVVCATNRNLRDAVVGGRFREELYYRINVIAIELPPLRERTGDVRLLAHAFLKRYGRGRVTALADDALATLEAYPWPGNVRELQNVIERACALADETTVAQQDLPDYVLSAHPIARATPTADAAVATGAPDLPLAEARERWMKTLESAYLRELLDRHHGNISAAAKSAGIDRKTFHRLVAKYGLR